ncbi:MAG: hypothetical protein ABIK83_11650 [Candidatus Zixiibacteriota bacterium]
MAQKSILVMAVLLLLSLVPSGFAFDGYRSGFILGFGLGPGITSNGDSHFGLQTDFRIGAGVNEQVQVYWSSKVSWYSVDYYVIRGFDYYSGDLYYSTDSGIGVFGQGGLGVSYYFQPETPSWFITGGVGYSSYAIMASDNVSDSEFGMGLSGGLGYEFSPHLNVEGGIRFGSPGEGNSLTSIMICLNALAY